MRSNLVSKYYIWIAAVLLFLCDLLVYFAYTHNYVVIFFKGTGFFIPLLINAGFLFYIAVHFDRWWLYILPSLLAFILGIYFVWIFILNSIVSWQYDRIHSPLWTETLTIGHRSATLGETTYIYEFYQTAFMGLLLKKLDGMDLSIMVRDSDRKEDLEVLNIKKPTWVNETTVIFHTLDGDKTVILK